MSEDRPRIQTSVPTPRRSPRWARPVSDSLKRAARAALLAMAALLTTGCGPTSPQTSSSTHWLRCSTDADCMNLALGARCGTDRYCAAADGGRLGQRLVFSEDFEGAALDTATFGYETGSGLRNAELQAYTDRIENVRVEGGALVLTARAEPFGDASYTSGSVHTQGEHAFAFGRFEVTLRAPLGQGANSSVWMLPDAPGSAVPACIDPDPCFSSSWPAWGDILIAIQRSEYPGRVLHGINYGIWDATVNGVRHGVAMGPEYVVEAPDSEWHVYALDWGPERMDWFVDGEPVSTLSLPPADLYRPAEQNPFHQPFFLKLSLAVGGLDQAPDAAEYPQELKVDSVRVWQWQPEG